MRYQIERLAFWIVIQFARLLPHSWLLSSGRMFGRFAYGVDRRHRDVALQNLQTALPEIRHNQAEKILHNCYGFFGAYLFDMLSLLDGFSPARMADFEFEGLEHLDLAYKRGKGVLIFTAHFGAWELMALAQGYKGYSMGVIARKLDNPYLERLLQKLRTSTGNFIIDKKDGFRPTLRVLREAKGIAILIDQNVTTEDRIFVDFFGNSASTTPALALLKLKTDATLIPAFAVPLQGNQYRFSYGAPVEVQISGDRPEDVRRITQECTKIIENQIRQFPEYWLWMHRRWKTRPERGNHRDTEPQSLEIEL